MKNPDFENRTHGKFTLDILSRVEKMATASPQDVLLFKNRVLQLCEEIKLCWRRIEELEELLLRAERGLQDAARANFLSQEREKEAKQESEKYRQEKNTAIQAKTAAEERERIVSQKLSEVKRRAKDLANENHY